MAREELLPAERDVLRYVVRYAKHKGFALEDVLDAEKTADTVAHLALGTLYDDVPPTACFAHELQRLWDEERDER